MVKNLMIINLLGTSCSKVAHTLPCRADNPHPKQVKECAQCSISGQSGQ
jgi:hypothetical protein